MTYEKSLSRKIEKMKMTKTRKNRLFVLAPVLLILLAACTARAYTNRGLAYHRKGDLDRATENYETALRLDPNFTWPKTISK